MLMGLSLLTFALIKVINRATEILENVGNDYVPNYVYWIIGIVFIMGGIAFFKDFFKGEV
ncbi:hypothetical protein DL346_01650 [Paenibacillus montanisoli]|uniref:Uncharacterized protein n=1 Tax=Paenibacillus montanisoli TaxID=2081970 RepID=A0A328U581_9BACL|nr:hypothetical protein DL346_01650 [Paenibacillus montanisoli]